MLVKDLIAVDFIDGAEGSEARRVLESIFANTTDVTGVTHDSRSVGAGSIFFALQGAKFDARELINQAFDRGAVAVVYDGVLASHPPGLAIKVKDARRALSYAAHIYAGKPSLRLRNFAITGTSGKTSVAWIMAQALHKLGRRTFIGGTLGFALLQHDKPLEKNLQELGNTTIDPLRVHAFLADAVVAGAEASVFEATSQGVVQSRMRDVAWDCAIFTNLSRDHLDLHGTMEAYEAAKCDLFTTDLAASPKQNKFAVINVDDPAGNRISTAIKERVPGVRVFELVLSDAEDPGSDQGERYTLCALKATTAGLSFALTGAGETIRIESSFIGTHNAYNLALAALALRAEGVAAEAISDVISRIPPVPGRLEPVGNTRVPVYVDYAHKPDALEKVLEFLRPLCRGRVISVFGCGGDRDVGKRPIMGEISYRLADVTIVTSDNPRTEDPALIVRDILAGIKASSGDRLIVEIDRRRAIAAALRMAQEGDIVLLAGKGHEPYQEINGMKYPFSDFEVAREYSQKN